MLARAPRHRGTATPALVVLLAALTPACERAREDVPAAVESAPRKSSKQSVSAEQRTSALRAAQVWFPPKEPLERARLGANPSGPGAFDESDVVRCRLVKKAVGGTTPKFDCELATGEIIRVKYGQGNPELHAEVAATRLLSALGFGADRMSVVRRVQCAGCTPFPFQSLRCLAETGLERPCFPRGIDYSKQVEFDHVAIERPLPGRRIEATADQGWAWYELDQVDPSVGGAPRSHVDALKLMAIFLAHWDNKAENQRLLCLPGGDLSDGGCSRPFALMQDLGASFGPLKLDLHNWRSTGVWADPRTCRISMEALPWGGGTFPEQQISDEGRVFLLQQLERLSTSQIEDLFEGARVDASEGVTGESRQPAAWAAAFQDKVRQIREAGPCGR